MRSYVGFTRSERAGIALLAGGLVCWLLVRALLFDSNAAAVHDSRMEVDARQMMHERRVQASMNEPVAINTADSARLVMLPGVGPMTAHHIMEYRKEHPIADKEQLRLLGRFSDSSFARLCRQVVFDTPASGSTSQ